MTEMANVLELLNLEERTKKLIARLKDELLTATVCTKCSWVGSPTELKSLSDCPACGEETRAHSELDAALKIALEEFEAGVVVTMSVKPIDACFIVVHRTKADGTKIVTEFPPKKENVHGE